MKITIDLRSALVGLVAGVVLMFTLGAAAVVPPGGIGRFQVSTSETMGLVIDTHTGQVWTARMNNAALQTDADFKTLKLK